MLSSCVTSRWKCLLAIAASTLVLPASNGIQQALAEGNLVSDNDGISLYGETAQANQPGQGYIIFEQQGENLIGAFYYPQSEYSCFTGKKKGQTLEILALPDHQEPMQSFDLSLNQMKSVRQIGTPERQTLSACRKDVVAFLNQQQTATEQNITQLANRFSSSVTPAAVNKN